MAISKITDVVVPEFYDQYTRENGIYTNALYKSGIISVQPRFVELLNGGAKQFEMPFWQSNVLFASTATPIKEGATITPTKLTGTKMTARRQFRYESFGWTDVAQMLAGSSVSTVVMASLDDYWNKQFNGVLFNSILGVIADNVANDSSDMIHDITAAADKYVSPEAIIQAKYKHGDMTGGFTGIAMHSTVKANLEKQNLIDNIPESAQSPAFARYNDLIVYTDDTLVSGTDYYTVIFKPGAFGFGYSDYGYQPTSVDRDENTSGGEEFLYTRRAFLMHPYGFSYSDDAAAAYDFPQNTELVKAANWDRNVASAKNTRFVVLKSLG